jgi:hypothetical protein
MSARTTPWLEVNPRPATGNAMEATTTVPFELVVRTETGASRNDATPTNELGFWEAFS